MIGKAVLVWFSFLQAISNVDSQSASRFEAEPNLPLEIQTCTVGKGCKRIPGSITLDANWRSVKDLSGRRDCFNGTAWDKSLCPDPETCARNCALGTIDYEKEKIATHGNLVNLKLFKDNGRDGSRIYLLDAQDRYQVFFLLNKELSFDVDVSRSSCGVASGIYFSAMKPDGGKSSTNQAGSKYGTGYCDAQGPRDMHFVDGRANLAIGPAGGEGEVGYACPELDVWEANSISQAFTVHNCQDAKATVCRGEKCRGLCDGPGCDFASFRMGNTSFYGPTKTVDTTKKITVVTQFITSDNTDNGELVEIRRFYKQGGRIIQNSKVNLPNASPFDSITNQFCDQIETIFGRSGGFRKLGGLGKMGAAMRNGMVLVMTIWADKVRGMSWLDGENSDKTHQKPGSARGTCPPGAGQPSNMKKHNPDAAVEFSDIRVGPIESNFNFKPQAM
ncbi:hypothetical protein PGT21_010159 [Puccinia graminis f. sp. tritici]|uniref:Glucanase n=1 Tax=Puccinia graminis f. sp. tritici TaxID=56615 RepID=A0A5B0QSS9_PUCGR|nr:hypothetical protein PGTUg99_025609 [Puccinia graminis f. sp. tritici]KAA1116347.1 hypothetical protein PGT21_010159 [Puccinia graminis f. sp. tritici]